MGQQLQQPPPVVRSFVNEVLVPVVVLDAQGHAVGNLTKDDFQVFDNGKPQMITGFTIIKRATETSAAISSAPSPDAGCRNPAPFSAGAHDCSMKSLSPIRILRVPQRGSHLSALPSDYSLLSSSSITFFTTLLRRNQLLHLRYRVVRPRTRPWPTSTLLLPIIEFP
jgi:hypothetical protein